jgi:hypothetical protein
MPTNNARKPRTWRGRRARVLCCALGVPYCRKYFTVIPVKWMQGLTEPVVVVDVSTICTLVSLDWVRGLGISIVRMSNLPLAPSGAIPCQASRSVGDDAVVTAFGLSTDQSRKLKPRAREVLLLAPPEKPKRTYPTSFPLYSCNAHPP